MATAIAVMTAGAVQIEMQRRLFAEARARSLNVDLEAQQTLKQHWPHITSSSRRLVGQQRKAWTEEYC